MNVYSNRLGFYRGKHDNTINGSVSDPYHFDADPDPRIRIRDDGSGS